MADTLRLFVGIDVGDAWTERLSGVADDLREALGRNARWVRPELFHVTVVFLGEQAPEAADEIGVALASAAARVEPFPLQLRELRRLGGHEHGAIVAAVDDPTERLQALRVHLDAALREHEIRFDAKALVPHVTLARPRRGSGPLPLEPVDLRAAPPLSVAEINVVHSDLSSGRPEYRAISTVRLGGH